MLKESFDFISVEKNVRYSESLDLYMYYDGKKKHRFTFKNMSELKSLTDKEKEFRTDEFVRKSNLWVKKYDLKSFYHMSYYENLKAYRIWTERGSNDSFYLLDESQAKRLFNERKNEKKRCQANGSYIYKIVKYLSKKKDTFMFRFRKKLDETENMDVSKTFDTLDEAVSFRDLFLRSLPDDYIKTKFFKDAKNGKVAEVPVLKMKRKQERKLRKIPSSGEPYIYFKGKKFFLDLKAICGFSKLSVKISPLIKLRDKILSEKGYTISIQKKTKTYRLEKKCEREKSVKTESNVKKENKNEIAKSFRRLLKPTARRDERWQDLRIRTFFRKRGMRLPRFETVK